METTFYALVLAVINLGYLISYWIGGLLAFLLNVGSDDFSNLWILILVSSLWPLVTLLYLFALPRENNLGLNAVQEHFQIENSQHHNTDQTPANNQSLLVEEI